MKDITIRHATQKDTDGLTALEAACFLPAEAAGRERFEERVKTFPEHFWLLEKEGELIGCINGCVSNSEELTDEMYAKASLHEENGDWQMIFGVMTLPKYQHRGYACLLMKHVMDDCKKAGRKGIILTCKKEKIGFYEQFGYENLGESSSEHGGSSWWVMKLML